MVWLRRSDSATTCDRRWRCTATSAKKKAATTPKRDDADHREELGGEPLVPGDLEPEVAERARRDGAREPLERASILALGTCPLRGSVRAFGRRVLGGFPCGHGHPPSPGDACSRSFEQRYARSRVRSLVTHQHPHTTARNVWGAIALYCRTDTRLVSAPAARLRGHRRRGRRPVGGRSARVGNLGDGLRPTAAAPLASVAVGRSVGVLTTLAPYDPYPGQAASGQATQAREILSSAPRPGWHARGTGSDR